MRSTTRLFAAVFLFSSALAACGDGRGSATKPDDIGLTRAEIQALNRAVLGLGSGVARSGASGDLRASAGKAPGTGSLTFGFDDTHACQPSGSARVAGEMSGSWDAQAQSAALDAVFAITHQGCSVPTHDGGRVVLTGDPDIGVTLTATSGAQGLTALRITQKGAFTWAKGESGGRCTVDVAAELVAGTEQLRLSGTFCGISVDGITEDAD